MYKLKEPILWFAGFQRWIKTRKFYEGYCGITILGKKFLGFNISDSTYLRSTGKELKNGINKTEREITLWIYISFYSIMIKLYNKKNYEE
jgi:hypothetical protein